MASGLMIAKVRSSGTKDSSEIFKCSGKMSALQNREKASGLKARATVSSFQCCGQSRTEVCRSFCGTDAGGGHRGVFVLGGALAAANDGAGVAHAASRGSGLAGDKADDRL